MENDVKEYTNNAADNRTSFVLKNNGVIQLNTTYEYDNMDRLEKVYEDGQLRATYHYDVNGNRSALIYANENMLTYGYNLANRLTELTNKQGDMILSQYTYIYFLDGKNTSGMGIRSSLKQIK